MKFKPNPLLYAANVGFYSTFKLSVTMSDPIDHAALLRAVAAAMPRYPYFSVFPEKCGNRIVLSSNPRPVPVFNDGRSAVLGSEECNGHLLFFGCEENKIFLNVSHYIADGMGIDPLLKTVLYLYVSELYGSDGLRVDRINLPSDPIADEEYSYPFPDSPIKIDCPQLTPKAPSKVYTLDTDAFDGDGLYAYHLRIPQRDMMSMASPLDGSPVSFLTVMMYRAFCALDKAPELPVVAHVQHQYRQALCLPLSRHSLVNYVPAFLTSRAKKLDTECLNTILRGQIILGSETAEDLRSVNRIINAIPQNADASLSEMKEAMRQYVERSIEGKSFGISYVGKNDWCGLDRYVKDIHAYIGEKHTKNMMLIEVMTVGEDFSVNLMQSGRGRTYLNAFMDQLKLANIPVTLVGEERYTLCDTVIPD